MSNTNVFLFYVQEILIPQLWVGAIAWMDNLPVHHAHVVREAIEEKGAKPRVLPHYSPDLSPIELCWSKPKQLLPSVKARTREALDQALTDIINNLLSCDDASWLVRSLRLTHLKTAVRCCLKKFEG